MCASTVHVSELTLSTAATNGATNRPNLVVNAINPIALFTTGQTYVFQLTVRNLDGQTNTAQTSPISINARPSSGSLVASPANGTAFQTVRKPRTCCVAWTAEPMIQIDALAV